MKNDLDRPLRVSGAMRKAGYFLYPERMSNQDLIDECIVLGTNILFGTYTKMINPADYYVLASDILECIEMKEGEEKTISTLMDRVADLVWEV